MTEAIILLVDDDQAFLDVLTKRLRARNMEVFTATNGAEAIERLQEHGEIEVVVLDVKMPGKSGNEVLRDIKTDYPLVEVVMLTGHASVENAIEGMKKGAVDYLMKPCDMDDLREVIKNAVTRKRDMESKIVEARINEIAARRA